MMNGREDHFEHAIMAAAWELADLLEEHSHEGLCSEAGLETIADTFGEIMPEVRAEVFERFILELEIRDIEYDMNQFGADA